MELHRYQTAWLVTKMVIIFYFEKKKKIESFNGSSAGELCKQGTASGKWTSVLSGAVIYAQTWKQKESHTQSTNFYINQESLTST